MCGALSQPGDAFERREERCWVLLCAYHDSQAFRDLRQIAGSLDANSQFEGIQASLEFHDGRDPAVVDWGIQNQCCECWRYA